MSNIGVLIVNLGSPAAPDKKSLRKYLKQFLSDKRIIQPVVGNLAWWFILNGIILNTRPKKSAKLYQSIWNKFGKGAPLIAITAKQLLALQAEFNDSNIKLAMAMRYGSPTIAAGVNKLLTKNIEKLIILPLYPQYSRTTTESVFDAVLELKDQQKNFPKLHLINNYHDHPNYIAALKASVINHQKQYGKPQKLIISYHGIPKIHVEKGDIYPQHCQKTTELLVKALELKEGDYMTCYQSIFGKLEWLKPYLDKTLQSLPNQGINHVQIICPGFAADCLETLEEVEHENKNHFLQAGGHNFSYIPALNHNSSHINCLAQIIRENI